MDKIKLFSMLLFVSIIGTVFCGCDSEEGNGNFSDNNESIVGFWIRYADNDQYLEELGFFDDGTCSYTESFIPDNDYEETKFRFGEGTYVLSDNILTMMLTFKGEKETMIFTVESLKTQKELMLVDEDGNTYVYDFFKSK